MKWYILILIVFSISGYCQIPDLPEPHTKVPVYWPPPHDQNFPVNPGEKKPSLTDPPPGSDHRIILLNRPTFVIGNSALKLQFTKPQRSYSKTTSDSLKMEQSLKFNNTLMDNFNSKVVILDTSQNDVNP